MWLTSEQSSPVENNDARCWPLMISALYCASCLPLYHYGDSWPQIFQPHIQVDARLSGKKLPRIFWLIRGNVWQFCCIQREWSFSVVTGSKLTKITDLLVFKCVYHYDGMHMISYDMLWFDNVVEWFISMLLKSATIFVWTWLLYSGICCN